MSKPHRRTVPREKQTEILTLFITPSIKNDLWVAAAAEGRTMSDLVRQMIVAALAGRKNGKRKK